MSLHLRGLPGHSSTSGMYLFVTDMEEVLRAKASSLLCLARFCGKLPEEINPCEIHDFIAAPTENCLNGK
jgi:hypothetical protein